MRYKNPPIGVVALIEKSGKLLFTKRNIEPQKGGIDLLGGFVEIGESLEEAMKREIKEEIGCAATSIQYFYSTPTQYGKRATLSVYFTCKIKGKPRLSAELQEIMWLKRAPSKFAFEADRKATKKYFKKRSHLINRRKKVK